MFTLLQSAYVRGSAGEPLPTVFQSLEDKRARFLRGQLVLVCAGPGSGKSALALTLALRARVPTLYISADSDAFTQLSRSISILYGWPQEKAALAVLRGDLDDVAPELEKSPIRFNYRSSPSLEQIETSIKAYDEVYGDFPALIVVDNITNVVTSASAEDPFAGLELLMEELHKYARETGACVIGLHHVNGPHNSGNQPIPLSGIKGQIGRVPELILTLHRADSEYGPDRLNVSVVKNRSGPMDPTGTSFVSLEFSPANMQIQDSR